MIGIRPRALNPEFLKAICDCAATDSNLLHPQIDTCYGPDQMHSGHGGSTK